jgi:hypothetical protein
VRLRIIDAQVSVTTSDGMRLGGRYRLATTLLDHRRYPAAELVALYHELPGAAGYGKTRHQAIGDVGGIHGARLYCAQPTVGLLSRPHLTFLGTGEGMLSRLALLMGLAQRRT